MKKPLVLIAAIVAVVGLGTSVAAGNDTTKVRTSVALKFTPTSPSDPDVGFFSGRVKAKNGCQKERVVSVYEVNGRPTNIDISDNRGRYRTGSFRFKNRLYIAKVEKTRITKNTGDKIVCRKGQSKVIDIH